MNERNKAFRTMSVLVIVLGLLMLLSVVASAQSYYQEMEIQLDGDYTLTTNLVLPEVNSNIDLAGVGQAFIKTKLVVVMEDPDSLKAWWDLF